MKNPKPYIEPDRLRAMLDAKQFGTVESVAQGLDALERMATDLDRYGFADAKYLAEQITYVTRQMREQTVEADDLAIEVADEEAKVETLSDMLTEARDWIAEEDGVSVKRNGLLKRIDKALKDAA
jgi:hypothetical protein